MHDIAFHRTVASASGNPIVASIVEMVSTLYYERRRQTAERAFPDQTDLETLRSALDHELNITVLSETFDASIIRPYLRSVQLLRHQLFSNFNTLVLVHQHRSKETRKAIKA